MFVENLFVNMCTVECLEKTFMAEEAPMEGNQQMEHEKYNQIRNSLYFFESMLENKCFCMDGVFLWLRFIPETSTYLSEVRFLVLSTHL